MGQIIEAWGNDTGGGMERKRKERKTDTRKRGRERGIRGREGGGDGERAGAGEEEGKR